jgi:hypothetical protein
MTRNTLSLSRRAVVASALTPVLIGAAGGASHHESFVNPIVQENALQTNSSWNVPLAAAPMIEGYASESSVEPGQQLHLHVSTTPSELYRVRIYRLGWYGGGGARLFRCSPTCKSTEVGIPQHAPPPAKTGEVNADWPVTDTVPIGKTWPTGYYIAQLVLMGGEGAGTASNVPFVIRERQTRVAPILVVAPITTWQAYNNWGGKSLYGYNSTNRVAATSVSFDRPYGPDSQSPLTWEYPLVRFLERNGYDVAYSTDVDADAHPDDLKRRKLVIVPGHSEYWSQTYFNALRDARDIGVSLAFFGADDGTWRVRYDRGGRAVIEYRSPTADPVSDVALRTGRFRDLGEPECRLRGVQYEGGHGKPTDTLRSYVVPTGLTKDPWFLLTGIGTGASLQGAVGYEWDSIVRTCAVPPLTVLWQYSGKPAGAAAVRYVAPSGARVFSAGSVQFAWQLDSSGGRPVNVGVEQFTRNLINDLSVRAATD